MELNLQQLHPDAVLPQYQTAGSAAFDLTAVTCNYVPRTWDKDKGELVGGYWEYGTGWAMEIPVGYVGLLVSRSSVRNMSQLLANCIGTIDSDYRGEVKASFKQWDDPLTNNYKIGDRVCQMIILPVEQVSFNVKNNLTQTQRGAGGHGSTGK